MYYKFDRRYNLLTVRDDYAYLRNVHQNGDLEFDFFYRVSPTDAIKHGSLTVAVTVFSRTVGQKQLLENSHTGHIDTRKLIGNILTQMPDAKNVIKQRDEFVVSSRNSDVSSMINNEIIGPLAAGVPAKDIQQLNRSRLKLVQVSNIKKDADTKPVLQRIAHKSMVDVHKVHSASISENPVRLMHDLIVKHGVDPSHVVNLTHRSVPAIDEVGGILRPSRAPEFENVPLERLLNYHVFPSKTHDRPSLTNQVSDDAVVHVLSNDTQVDVEVPVSILLPRHAFQLEGKNSSHFFAKFDLINGKGATVDTVVKSLDVARHLQFYYTPRRPPIVKVAKSEISTRANLEIKQVDVGATGVQVYKKTVYHAVTDVDDYVLVGTYNVRHNDQTLLVQVDVPRDSTVIYRVVPVGNQGTVGFEYTNVVVKPQKYRKIKSVVLSALPTDIGVKLEVRHIPQHVVSVELKARNRTTFEAEFRNVGGDVLLVDDAIRSVDFLTVVDRDARTGNVYEYVVRLIYESGTDELVGNTLVEFISQTPGKVNTIIENVNVVQENEPNVTFTINTSIVDSHIDVVKSLLQRQGVYDVFKNDVAREREFLKSLIAHNVQRVDLSTGLREDFGVITTSSFDDRALRKNQAIKPLKVNHRYRYEIVTLLRAPETMFEELAKEKVDAVTKKSYAYKPSKFLHPVTLNRGVLVSSAGLKARYSKEQMSHGAVGSIETVEISFDEQQATIIDPAATRFDKFLNVITWKVQGDVNQIDHFVIMKDIHNVRTLIGKAHSEFVYGNCQYFHNVSRRDEGSFTYIIAPVFNDYKVGAQASTNAVIVEPFTTYIKPSR